MTRILSLDDEPELLALYRLILERRGYEHISTTDSHQALDILRTEPIDLFTQDLLHPGMDGWQVLGILRSEPKLNSIPVLIISSVVSIAKATLDTTVYDYLSKPFSVPELVDAVERQLVKHGKPLPAQAARLRASIRQESITGLAVAQARSTAQANTTLRKDET